MSGFKIHCENIGCRYVIRQGHRRSTYHDALAGVTFTLAEGERLGLVGVNGAGKSTLLRILAGVLYPTSGRHLREGNPTTSLLSLANQWYPELSGRENAILACLMAGLRRRDAEERYAAIAEFSELGEWLDRPVRTYSTGMSARLGLASALQIKPDVLMLDETLGVGDAGFMEKATRAVLDTIQMSRSVVLVSHDNASIAALCTRVLWLERGQIRADGPAEEVVAAYLASLHPGG